MKMINKIGFAAGAAALYITLAPSAHALCSVALAFGQYPGQEGTCGGGSCYVISPTGHGAAVIKGNFWAFTTGNPVVSLGNDNGSYDPQGTDVGATQPWLQQFTQAQIIGNWNSGRTDGCAKGSANDRMIVEFSDSDANNGYYAVSAADRTGLNPTLEWDFTKGNQHINLQPIPKPTITATSRSGNAINVTITWTPNATNAFTPNASGLTAAQVVTGWSVRKFEVARAAGAPTDRARGNWTEVASAAGAAANTASFTFTCADVTNNNAFLSLSPNFDSGFGADVVSGNSTRIECNPNLAEPGTKFKVVDRKTGARPK